MLLLVACSPGSGPATAPPPIPTAEGVSGAIYSALLPLGLRPITNPPPGSRPGDLWFANEDRGITLVVRVSGPSADAGQFVVKSEPGPDSRFVNPDNPSLLEVEDFTNPLRTVTARGAAGGSTVELIATNTAVCFSTPCGALTPEVLLKITNSLWTPR